MDIGKKLKKYRTQNDLTLEELASRCELSKGFLSQIENDITSPSIATLNDIVEVLGMNLSEFFKDEKAQQIVFTEEDYFEDEKENRKLTWLVPNAMQNEMEPILLQLAQNTQSDIVLPHEGEEFAYVLKGRVSLVFGEQEHELKEGDVFYFSSTESHYLINHHAKVAHIIWVSTPPIF